MISSSARVRPNLRTEQHVLLVEDCVDTAAVFAISLRKLGYEVDVAVDALFALEIALAMTPNIVVIDIGLPVVDGFELARRLRQVRGFATTPFIAVSGYSLTPALLTDQDWTFAASLQKPVDIRELAAVIDALCSSVGCA
jgi:DNA-binding response OmpR family regulator